MSKIKTNKLSNSQRGFTIVELLIVIVVIAILAAITVVGFNGIQNRANDAAVSSDVSNLVKKIKMLEVDLGFVPPAGQRATGSGSVFPGISFSPSKSSYVTDQDNLFYCEGLKSGQPQYAVTAKSKSGKVFIYRSNEGMSTVDGSAAYSQCSSGFDSGQMYYTFGYNLAGKNWFGWTNS